MIYGLSARSWFTAGNGKFESYSYRYAPDWHCDLMDQLSDYKASPAMKLDDMAAAIGLPGKIGGHGSEVESMVERGDMEGVRAYCECDCLNLFALYVRWGLLSGKTDADAHDASICSLISCLEAERHSRPHFGEFLDSWRTSRQPSPMFTSKQRHPPASISQDLSFTQKAE
jgi:predicted PolB exonuclease-like 3'-5' exonuclease